MSDSPTLAELQAVCQRLEARLDVVESVQAIERLAHRYAFAADARDLESILLMFVDDVDCGRLGTGREALRASYEIIHRGFYRTVHQVVGHTIEFDDGAADGLRHATGKVMMRAEHEVGERWVVAMLCMFDTYERRDGQWYFVRRKPESWYSTEFDERPAGPNWLPDGWAGRPPRLPHLFETWSTFWQGHDDQVSELTNHP